MRMVLIFLLGATGAVAGDVRYLGGAEVDLTPLQQWRATNGPATNRPLQAWKPVRVLEVRKPISVYTECLVSIGGLTELVLADHLPDRIKQFVTQESQLESRIAHLNSFVTAETMRLHTLATAAQKAGTASPFYNQFVLDQRNLESSKEELAQSSRQLADMKRQAPVLATDYAVLLDKSYIGLPIWDFGRKVEPPTI